MKYLITVIIITLLGCDTQQEDKCGGLPELKEMRLYVRAHDIIINGQIISPMCLYPESCKDSCLTKFKMVNGYGDPVQ